VVNGCAGSARSWPIDLKLFDEIDNPEDKRDNYEETVPNDRKRNLDTETPVDAPVETPVETSVDSPVDATEVEPQGSVEKNGKPSAPAGAAKDKKYYFNGDEQNKHSVNNKNLMSEKIIRGTQCYMSMKIKNFI
jgi:hypothetical protein